MERSGTTASLVVGMVLAAVVDVVVVGVGVVLATVVGMCVVVGAVVGTLMVVVGMGVVVVVGGRGVVVVLVVVLILVGVYSTPHTKEKLAKREAGKTVKVEIDQTQ